MTGTSLELNLQSGIWTPFGVPEDGKVYGNENTTIVEVNLYNNETKLYEKISGEEENGKIKFSLQKSVGYFVRVRGEGTLDLLHE